MVLHFKPHKVQVGMTLSDRDIEAIQRLFSTVWGANVTLGNWKEKGSGNYCQWQLSVPDKDNVNFTVTKSDLVEAVDSALSIHFAGVDYKELLDGRNE